MAKGWYILHTYSGYEGKIERTIRSYLESGDLSSDVVLDIKVPVEDVVEVKDGVKKEKVKKMFLKTIQWGIITSLLFVCIDIIEINVRNNNAAFKIGTTKTILSFPLCAIVSKPCTVIPNASVIAKPTLESP